MRLYLVQHGQALSEEEDPRRPLSEKGRAETERIGRFLQAKLVRVDYIWHSKKTRAVETASIVAQHISNAQTLQRDDLNPKDAVDKFPQQIQNLNKDLLIVGHLPFLQRLAALLLTGSEDYDLIAFRYSGVVCLEYSEGWKIAWMAIPDFV